MRKQRRLRKLDKSAKWWIGAERPTDWLVEKNGDWWIIPDSRSHKEEKGDLWDKKPQIKKTKLIKKYDSSLLYLSAVVALLAIVSVALAGTLFFYIF